MYGKTIKLFIRIGLAAGFISAAVDRFGIWPEKYTFLGNDGELLAGLFSKKAFWMKKQNN